MVLPRNSILCEEVGGEGLLHTDCLLCCVVGPHPGNILQSSRPLLWHTAERCMSPPVHHHEVMQDTGSLHRCLKSPRDSVVEDSEFVGNICKMFYQMCVSYFSSEWYFCIILWRGCSYLFYVKTKLHGPRRGERSKCHHV
jgi:hypothetical protein